MNYSFKVTFILLIFFMVPAIGMAQNSFDMALKNNLDSLFGTTPNHILYPNSVPVSALTPNAWSGRGTYAFAGIGFAYPQLYISHADMVATAGLMTGNPFKAVSVTAFANMNDVSKLRNFSYNLIVTRDIGGGSSISAGGLNLFFNHLYADAGASYYFAFSHAIQTMPSSKPGVSALSYTIGIGTDRFYDKSPDDILHDRGKYGTAVFGNISYELFKWTNINAEWTGLNLGFSAGITPGRYWPSLLVGVADVTRSSGNRTSFITGIGYALSLTPSKK